MISFIVQKKYRLVLKKPLGKVYKNSCHNINTKLLKKISRYKNSNKILITIGDVTTSNFISSGVNPNICIIDGKTKRNNYKNLLKLMNDYELYYVNNEHGCISLSVIKLIKKRYSYNYIFKKKVCIVINGEEDLLVLPVLLFSNINNYIFYGQPNKGIVIIKSCLKIKEKVFNLLNSFSISKTN